MTGNEAVYSNFWMAKEYLNQVKDLTGLKAVLEKRIALRNGADADELIGELNQCKAHMRTAAIAVSDLASLLPDVSGQMVIIKRYVDLEPWEQIADEMGCTLHRVLKLHGQALPVLEEIVEKEDLAADGNR